MTCIECQYPLPPDHIRLTEQAAMCQHCYAEAEASWFEEFTGSVTPQGVPAYCPHPRELRERIEAVRARIGSEPHSVYAKPVNTMIYERHVTAVKCSRKAVRTI